MSEVSRNVERNYLRGEQYKDSRNLNARIELHRRFSSNPYGWARWLFDRLEESVGTGSARILEIGCGPAVGWRANRTRIPDGWVLQLTDFSLGMVGEARDVLGRRADYALADAQALPFADDSFDVVVANHMIYHIPDRPRAFAEFARVLVSGGVLFASTVGERHLEEIDVRLRAFGLGDGLLGTAVNTHFTLENGGTQLAGPFGEVARVEYEDSLRVTEVEPLLDYVRSMTAGEELTAAMADDLRADVKAEIAAHGWFFITKSSGVFTARNA